MLTRYVHSFLAFLASMSEHGRLRSLVRQPLFSLVIQSIPKSHQHSVHGKKLVYWYKTSECYSSLTITGSNWDWQVLGFGQGRRFGYPRKPPKQRRELSPITAQIWSRAAEDSNQYHIGGRLALTRAAIRRILASERILIKRAPNSEEAWEETIRPGTGNEWGYKATMAAYQIDGELP